MTEHITTFADGSTIETWQGGYGVSGGMAMFIYKLNWLRVYLPFEMRTGMVMSHKQSALDVARSLFAVNFRTRKQALAYLNEYLAENNLEPVKESN